MASLISSSRGEFKIKKIFLNFIFFELSRIEVMCEHGIFGSLLFTFTVIFVRINIFFYEKFNSKLDFTPLNKSIFGS